MAAVALSLLTRLPVAHGKTMALTVELQPVRSEQQRERGSRLPATLQLTLFIPCPSPFSLAPIPDGALDLLLSSLLGRSPTRLSSRGCVKRKWSTAAADGAGEAPAAGQV